MDILQQCQKWHENNEHQKIVDALEAIPAQERTPEIDMSWRGPTTIWRTPASRREESCFRALNGCSPTREALGDDSSFVRFPLGGGLPIISLIRRAGLCDILKRHWKSAPVTMTPKSLSTGAKKGISLPQFSECFRGRTENWWETFAEMEAELRQMMDEDKDHTRGAELVAQMEGALNQAFDEISFEMGFNGEKHELILTPEGDKVKLFELVYFQKHAPKEVLEHWNILVGRQPVQNIGLRTNDGWEISGDDVQIWLEEQGENSFAISAYCEKLLPKLQEEEGRAWWMLTTLTDQVLGEISHMRYIDSFDVLEEPKAEPSFLLSQLPDKLREQGRSSPPTRKPIWRATLVTKWNPNRTRTPIGGWM